MNEQQRAQLAIADQARRIIEDPLFVKARESVLTGIRDQVFALPVEMIDDIKSLVLMEKVARQFFNVFELQLHQAEVTRYELMAEEHTAARRESIKEKARSYAG